MHPQATAPRRVSGHVELRKRKREDQWYMRYRLPDGRQIQKRLGPVWSKGGRPPEGYFTKRTAQARLTEVLADAQRGVLPGLVRTGATVADAVEEWLRYCEQERGVRATTIREYRSSAKTHLLPAFGDRKLEAVTRQAIEAWKSQLLTEGRLSRRTINKLLTNLNGVFERARDVWHLQTNPVSAVKRLRESYDLGKYDFFSPEEVWVLVRSARSNPDVEARVAEQDAAIFLTAAFSGLRMGEVLGLRWRDVDFDGELIRVTVQWNDLGQVTISKGGLVRSVPMVAEVAQALAELSKRGFFTGDDDPVFVGVQRWRREVEDDAPPEVVETITEHVDRSALRRRYTIALDRAGLRKLKFHDLRHTFGSLAINRASPVEVQAWMGHADLKTTMRYLHHKSRAGEAKRLAGAFAVADEAERVPVEAL
jgi:integrase